VALGELDNTEKRVDWGQSRKGLCAFCQMQGWKPPAKKGPSTKLGFHRAGLDPEYKSKRRYVFGIYVEKEMVVDSENAALQEGWDCKAKELCVSARRPLPVFFCVRSVIINSRLR